jgi:hypothetical protein
MPPGAIGEILASKFLNGCLEHAHKIPEVFNFKFCIELDTLFLLDLIHYFFKWVNIFLALWLHT